MSLPARIAVYLINAYQRVFSPDHGGFITLVSSGGSCRFYPSCSEYAKEAILKKGLFSGALKGAWRIARCNPFSRGGYDPVTAPAQKSEAK